VLVLRQHGRPLPAYPGRIDSHRPPRPLSTIASSLAVADPVVQGAVDILLDNRSQVRGVLLPFRQDDPLLQVAMDVDDGACPPMRIERSALRALKLKEWPHARVVDAVPRPFQFEFDDGDVLDGHCVRATTTPQGAWLHVVQGGAPEELWFVDWRHCVRATLDGEPLSARPRAGSRMAPARPDTLDALWSLVTTTSSVLEGASGLPDALLRAGWIDSDALRRAEEFQRRPGDHPPLERALVDIGAISDAQLRMARAEWMGTRVVDPAALVPDPAALSLLARPQAQRCQALPLLLRDDVLVVLVADPGDQAVLDELRFVTQKHLLFAMALPGSLAPAMGRAYGASAGAGEAPRADGAANDARSLADVLMAAPEGGADRNPDVVTESDSALVRLINSVISEAIAKRASDIHVETADHPRHVRIRLRIDGEMLAYVELPARLRFAVVARLKIMADLDISEHRRPQDGKIDFARFGGPHVELRVVTVPTSRGLEDVVLRLLSGLKPRALDDIDLSPDNLARLRAAVLKPYGLVLICGPTGCGKTTTLHSVLRELNVDARKIWTAEDPIEITQDGLRQVQVNPQTGWTFAAAMRTFLRADPDVIMIGEMRDEETARIAIDASLTGHLVLSTLHTNSAPESIARLLEIGLDPFNFSDSLLAILAQRLVRRLCLDCRESVVADESELDNMAGLCVGDPTDADARARLRQGWLRAHGDEAGRLHLFRRRGCARCEGHGYVGRLAIHELMLADDAIRVHIRHREAAAVLQASALSAGMKTLRQDGIDKVLAGLTDLSEVVAATSA